ncbi:hypothetical protein ACXZ1K_17370 [Pedobacter sp. PWIIR3]
MITGNLMVDASETADLRVLKIQEVDKLFGKLKETSLVAESLLSHALKFPQQEISIKIITSLGICVTYLC